MSDSSAFTAIGMNRMKSALLYMSAISGETVFSSNRGERRIRQSEKGGLD
jgi:hypothetical protein